MTFASAGDAAQSLKGMAGDAKILAMEMDKAGKAAKEQAGTKGGGAGGLIGGLKIYAAVKSIEVGFGTAARAADILNNSMLTQAQKTQSLAESLPIIGGIAKAVRELGEAANGTTDALRRSAEAFQLNNRYIAIEAQQKAQLFQFNARDDEADARIAATFKLQRRGIGLAPVLPKDMLDDRELADFQRRFPQAQNKLAIMKEFEAQKNIERAAATAKGNAADEAEKAAKEAERQQGIMNTGLAIERGGIRQKAGI